MKDSENMSKKISRGKAVGGCFLALAVLVLAQSLALFISLPLPALGLSGAVCNTVAGLLYAAFALGGALLLGLKFFALGPGARRPEPVWLLSAPVLPTLVLLAYMALGAHWTVSPMEPQSRSAVIAGALVFYGLAAGIAEELVFRGLIMGSLERAFDVRFAVLLPSVLFGALHLIGGGVSLLGALQLIIAGSLVGILFSLITLESGSVWNAAIVHGLWNAVFAGGFVHVGNTAEREAVFSLVFNSSSFLLTGGDFGGEASLVSALAYAVFGLLAYRLMKKKGILKNS